MGPRRNYHEGWAAIRHYANQPARPFWLINRFAALSFFLLCLPMFDLKSNEDWYCTSPIASPEYFKSKTLNIFYFCAIKNLSSTRKVPGIKLALGIGILVWPTDFLQPPLVSFLDKQKFLPLQTEYLWIINNKGQNISTSAQQLGINIVTFNIFEILNHIDIEK